MKPNRLKKAPICMPINTPVTFFISVAKRNIPLSTLPLPYVPKKSCWLFYQLSVIGQLQQGSYIESNSTIRLPMPNSQVNWMPQRTEKNAAILEEWTRGIQTWVALGQSLRTWKVGTWQPVHKAQSSDPCVHIQWRALVNKRSWATFHIYIFNLCRPFQLQISYHKLSSSIAKTS